LQQLSQQHQAVLDNQRQLLQDNQTILQLLLQQNQAIMNRLGKSLFKMICVSSVLSRPPLRGCVLCSPLHSRTPPCFNY